VKPYPIITSVLALSTVFAVACSSEDSPADGTDPVDNPVDGSGGFTGGDPADGSGGTSTTDGSGGGSLGGAGNMGSGGGETGGTGGTTTGGMGGEMNMGGDTGSGGETQTGGKPELTVTLDDNEAYDDLATPDGVSAWGRWDPSAAISTVQAQSGTKSIRLLDDDGGDAPEIRQSFTAATRGVFQTSMYVVPTAGEERKVLFTMYGDSASSANILADVRFDQDVNVDLRDAAGDWTDANTSGLVFAPETWLDLEIAWDTTVGDNGSIWITVDDTEIGPLPLHDSTRGAPQYFVIKMGNDGGTDATAAVYLDDIGLATE